MRSELLEHRLLVLFKGLLSLRVSWLFHFTMHRLVSLPVSSNVYSDAIIDCVGILTKAI